MPKTIVLNKVKIKDMTISIIDDKININFAYSLTDNNGIEYQKNTATILEEDLTQAQKNFVFNILDAIESKIKIKEKL